MHTHTAAGLAVAAQKQRAAAAHAARDALHGLPRATTTTRASRSTSTSSSASSRDLGAHNAMILRNHGLLTCGATVRDAFDLMYYLERACQAQVGAMAGGAELVVAAAGGRAQGGAPVRASRPHRARQRVGGAAAHARPHRSVVQDVTRARRSDRFVYCVLAPPVAVARPHHPNREERHDHSLRGARRRCRAARARRSAARARRSRRTRFDKPVRILVGFAAGRHRRPDRARRRRQDEGQPRPAGDRREPAGRDRPHRRRRGEDRRARRHDDHGDADRPDGRRAARLHGHHVRPDQGLHADRDRRDVPVRVRRGPGERREDLGRVRRRGRRRIRARRRTRRPAPAACRISSACCSAAASASRWCTCRTRARPRTSTT